MRTLRFFGAAVVAAGLVLSGACTDAPSAPEAEEGAGAAQLAIAPKLAVSGGPAATSHSQADALREAFELVDRFRLVVRRLDGEVVADEVVEVSGEPPYDLSLSVPVQQLNEEFDVELTALDGSVQLFRAGPFRVRSTPEGGPTQTTPVDASLEYVGPGATAASIELEPGVVALSPGGTATLEATVRGEGGNVERGVPLSWSSSDEGRLTVGDDGGVEGVADGAATVTVVSPNGVSATASVYVVAGQVAFVRGGGIHQASVGGEASTLVESGSLPAWSGDGSTLFYVRGGAVHRMGGGQVTSGSWPSLSPDGTTLAVERGGTVYFVNPDGTNATQGPNGGQPVWAPGGNALMVSGGGPIERVHASGESRQTVAGEAGAGMPAVATGGAVAYRGADGGIFVGTTRISPEGRSSSSRPALSANGRWVVFEAGGELQVAPADGGGAPVSFGVGSGSDPAWRGHGFTTDPPEVRVEGTSPESPKVGDEVTISGSGFDWIIPANNRVTFPGGEGGGGAGAAGVAEAVPATVLGVTAGSITTVVPQGVEPGELVVETRWGRASLDFQPTGSTLAIRAETESGGPVAGVGVTATAGDGSTTSATTGEDGTATIEDLAGGSYTLEWSAPEGFSVEEAPSSVELPWSETVEVTATLAAEVVDFELVPAEPRVEVGESVELEVRALDVLGNEVGGSDIETNWRVLISRVEIEGDGLSRTLTGVHPSSEPGDARFEVTVEGVVKRFGATVTSRIAGRVIDDGGTPLEGIEVGLSGEESASAATDAEGRYRFGGLFAGGYTVRATPPAEHQARPPSHEITLWEANPIGTAGFTMIRPEPEGDGGGGGGEIAVFNDFNMFDEGGINPDDGGNLNNQTMIKNLVTFSGSGPRASGTVVQWDIGHNAWCFSLWCSPTPNNDLETARTVIENAGISVVYTQSDVGTLSVPAPNVKVLFLWTPQAAYTASEISAMRQFLSEGGRIVYVGEGVFSSSAIAAENQFLDDMGSPLNVIDNCLDGAYIDHPASSVGSHQITTGMSGYRMGCAAELTLGVGDIPLLFDSSGSRPVAAVTFPGPMTEAPALAPERQVEPAEYLRLEEGGATPTSSSVDDGTRPESTGDGGAGGSESP